ncbi:MAG: CotH kinase family protein [Lachnospiraceae bacterium]|jgi:hypothetical protein|nr:CotH kinase family protein [Lachnospiraceae bacterium]
MHNIRRESAVAAFYILLLLTVLAVFATQALESWGIQTYSFPLWEYPEEVRDSIAPRALPREDEVSFSLDGYFYDDTVELSFLTDDEDIIALYYTMDGSPPAGENGILYRREIELSVEPPTQALETWLEAGKDFADHVNCYAVKVCGQRADGSFTDTYTHTYFVGENVHERFSAIVFSLTTDPHNLYGEDYGIFGARKMERGREAERPVYVELIDQSGQLILAQNAGFRVFGGWARHDTTQFLRLFARREYDRQNTFAYDFFPDYLTYYGRQITEYKRVTLRGARTNDAIAMLLAAKTALPDTQSKRAALVFLNGEWYLFSFLTQVYDKDYFNSHNEMLSDEWVVLDVNDGRESADIMNPTESEAGIDYEYAYSFHERDLTDDDVFNELGTLVDIENYLTYYAIEIYLNNEDWPEANMKAYRYYGEDASKNDDGTSTADGRWRWLMYDIDNGLQFHSYRLDGNDLVASILAKTPSLDIKRETKENNLPIEDPHSPLLIALLERDDMKARFVTIMCDLMNGHFSPQNVERAAYEVEAMRANEYEWRDAYIETVTEFGKKRAADMPSHIENYLEVDPAGFVVACSPHELADIKVNSYTITGHFSGFYYDICTVTLAASQPVGHEFSHWLVNGEAVGDEVLTLTKAEAIDGRVAVQLVTKPSEKRVPVVVLIDHKGSMDYIEIHNPYTEDINLRRFFISDDPENPYKQYLADYVLKVGESVKLYADNYRTPDALGGLKLSFNLKDGETLAITDMSGENVFDLRLPNIDRRYLLALNTRNGVYEDVPRQ